MKKNLTIQECKTLYPYNNAYVMMGSQDLRAKLTRQVRNFSKPSKLIINMDVHAFGILQAMLKTLSEHVMPWFAVEIKNFGMTVRFSDLLLSTGKKTEHATISVTADVPHYFRNTAFRVVRVISSNMFVTSAIPANIDNERVSCFKDLDITISKKPICIAMAADIDAPDHAFPEKISPVYWFPFSEDGEIDNPNSPFYKFCHSEPSLSLCKSLGEISIIIGVMRIMLPDEYRDQIFEEMPDGSFTLHFPDDNIGAELVPYIAHALTRDITKGIISGMPKLNSLIDDEITLDEAGVNKLISLWRGEEYKNIPSDLVRNKTVPMIGCVIKYNNKTYKIVTRVIDLNEDTNEIHVVEPNADETDSAGYFEVRYSNGYTVSKDIQYTDDYTELYVTNIDIDEEDSDKILKAWYGIQLSLMHPIIRVAIENQCSQDTTVVTESTNHKPSKKKEIERHIRHYYNITGDVLTKVLDGNCRHNHRHTMSWYVIGHWRTYKDGHQIFIKGHWRGPLKDTYSAEVHRKRDIDM